MAPTPTTSLSPISKTCSLRWVNDFVSVTDENQLLCKSGAAVRQSVCSGSCAVSRETSSVRLLSSDNDKVRYINSARWFHGSQRMPFKSVLLGFPAPIFSLGISYYDRNSENFMYIQTADIQNFKMLFDCSSLRR